MNMNGDELGNFEHPLVTTKPQKTVEQTVDAKLLARFVRRNDQLAFEELVRRHGPMVMGVCRRVLHNPHDAEDAFQATFLVLAQKSARIRSPELLGNWLYGVAYRIARKARKSQGSQLPMTHEEPATKQLGPDVALREVQTIIDEEMHRLPDRDRLLLTLCYFQGLTHIQVARQLGWPLGSVSRRLTKAQERLRVRLRRRGLTLSIGFLLLLLSQIGGSAFVSAALIGSTARACTAFAAGNSLNIIVSLRVAALARTMAVTPLSLAVLLLMFLLFLGPCGMHIDAGGVPETRASVSEGSVPVGTPGPAPTALATDGVTVESAMGCSSHVQ
jgi:RNA polymerase sigma factor (sigma-70 family)